MRFKDFYITEAAKVEDVPKEKGKQEVVIMSGRFQPVTAGHVKVIKQMKSKYSGKPIIVFLVKGEKSGQDKTKNPLDEKTQIKLLKKSMKGLIKDVLISKSAFIGDLLIGLRPKYEPIAFYTGTDRLKGYQGMIDRYKDDMNMDIKMEEIKRTGENISATKVRQSIKDNDFKTFQSMTTNLDKKDFDMLRKKIK